MQGLPLGKIRNFGGKLGAELQSMGCTTAGQVSSTSLTLEITGVSGYAARPINP